ncbi:hypothetical protein RJ55_06994 [Drechmeria coniospora]|nr:hypothetical protein RJ55_06994 [Drechmeria coniospora]
MKQKQKYSREAFFGLEGQYRSERPVSVTTEFVDTDWDEQIASEAEENSPRVSLQSSGHPSIATVSSYDEALTPRSSRGRKAHVESSPKQVEGPRGPHLFRQSIDSSILEGDAVLTLSPMTPKSSGGLLDGPEHAPPALGSSSPFQYSDEELEPSELASWTPEMVAQSMHNAGIELFASGRFIENDISGGILITLKFQDLRELNIPSFGIRTKVWSQIQLLREEQSVTPPPTTPIEDVPSQEVRFDKESTTNASNTSVRGGQSSQRNLRRRERVNGDTVTPLESVSIIGIEQVIPKPHHCPKGENCSKWKRQQRAMADLKKANPNLDLQAGGSVLIFGDAGNPQTAQAIDPKEALRPISDAVHSVAASSDILGPQSLPPLQHLQEAVLRSVRARDPQENVRQFLGFQKQTGSNEVPPTPPFEFTPALKTLRRDFGSLPKLSIPIKATSEKHLPLVSTGAPATPSDQPREQPQRQSPPQQGFTPYRMDKANPISAELETSRNPRRFGTPFSELDVPVTAVQLGTLLRDVSQSVPPDMNYRSNMCTALRARSQSRASAVRPSFPTLPVVDENLCARAVSKTPIRDADGPPIQPRLSIAACMNHPCVPVESGDIENSPSPLPSFGLKPSHKKSGATTGVSFQGQMKKRKMSFIRNEWQDVYFTLKGTRLSMHKDATKMDRTLEYVDIDEYSITCSGVASTSKLSAALKAMGISHNRDKGDLVAAFSFQLIPHDKEVGARLRRRDSSLFTSSTATTTNTSGELAEGINGTGKTYHFAVKDRDERIDWMRELMLAKALKQKGQGFEISVNGSMI